MIKELRIRNFKSIRSLDIDVRRVNILIGLPDSGKTNILESLGLVAWREMWEHVNLEDVIRLPGYSHKDLLMGRGDKEEILVYLGATGGAYMLNMKATRRALGCLLQWESTGDQEYIRVRVYRFGGTEDIYPRCYAECLNAINEYDFYSKAVAVNSNAMIVLDDPVAAGHPCYARQLGGLIASDDENQYFLSTNSPYLLRTILERADKNQVHVFVVYLDATGTRAKCLSNEDKREILTIDPFFNMESFYEDNGGGCDDNVCDN